MGPNYKGHFGGRRFHCDAVLNIDFQAALQIRHFSSSYDLFLSQSQIECQTKQIQIECFFFILKSFLEPKIKTFGRIRTEAMIENVIFMSRTLFTKGLTFKVDLTTIRREFTNELCSLILLTVYPFIQT